jgi:hypothetical protein
VPQGCITKPTIHNFQSSCLKFVLIQKVIPDPQPFSR